MPKAQEVAKYNVAALVEETFIRSKAANPRISPHVHILPTGFIGPVRSRTKRILRFRNTSRRLTAVNSPFSVPQRTTRALGWKLGQLSPFGFNEARQFCRLLGELT
jgi:hypothetical protein